MTGPAAALTWVELIAAVLAIVGGLMGTGFGLIRSAEGGLVHKYIIEPRLKAQTAHEHVEVVERKVDDLSENIEEVAERQRVQTYGIIAIGESISNGVEFDVDTFRKMADGERSKQFLHDKDDDKDNHP